MSVARSAVFSRFGRIDWGNRWPFSGCGGGSACGLCPKWELGARASPSEFYPAGKLQWQFTCGFDFGHCLWSLEGVNGKLHFLWSAVDDFQLYSIVIPNSKSSWNSTHEVDIQHSFLFKYLSLVLTGRVFVMLVFTLRC